MSIAIRPWRKNGKSGLEVDIIVVFPSGERHRERKKSPVTGRDATGRWAKAREAEILRRGPEAAATPTPESNGVSATESPSVEMFSKTWIDDYARANGNSIREIESKQTILRLHILPHLGSKLLDDVGVADIQHLKSTYRAGCTLADGTVIKPTSSLKTINNRLAVISKLLKTAHSWGARTPPAPPVEIKAIKDNLRIEFYEADVLTSLVTAAATVSNEALVTVLLGADAGLRRGEILGLNLEDVDFGRRQIYVQRQIVKGIEVRPKGGKTRYVPTTQRLWTALQSLRHLRGKRVLYHRDRSGTTREVTPKILRMWMQQAERAAGLHSRGALHILRHTFCSHLAMRGAPLTTIKDLAGHEDLKTTMRYMHLCSGARHDAIALLDAQSQQKAKPSARDTA